MNLHGGAHCPLGVIAVSDRRAKQSHRRVADVLVDGPAEAVDDRVDQREKAFQQRMNVFRIQLGREARVANQITEKNRDRATVSLGRLAATFNRRRNACVGEEPATTAAIPSAALVGVTAFGASRRECRAAGRTELASLTVVEFAARTAHEFSSVGRHEAT